MRTAIGDITGKTIRSVIVSEYNEKGPRTQVFLVFNDDSYYELYGDFRGAGGVDQGDEGRVIAYARQSQGKISRYSSSVPPQGPGAGQEQEEKKPDLAVITHALLEFANTIPSSDLLPTIVPEGRGYRYA